MLDAPELQDDFYLNLVDWSAQNVLAVGLGSCVYLWSACTSQVSKNPNEKRKKKLYSPFFTHPIDDEQSVVARREKKKIILIYVMQPCAIGNAYRRNMRCAFE